MGLDEWGRIVWTLTHHQFGFHAISLGVSDGEDTPTLSWRVNASEQTVNRLPSITFTPSLLTKLQRVYQYQFVGEHPINFVLGVRNRVSASIWVDCQSFGQETRFLNFCLD